MIWTPCGAIEPRFPGLILQPSSARAPPITAASKKAAATASSVKLTWLFGRHLALFCRPLGVYVQCAYSNLVACSVRCFSGSRMMLLQAAL